MSRFLVVALVGLTLATPLLMDAPTAHACRPYTYYCPLTGQMYHTCGNEIPPSLILCVKDATRYVELP